MSKGGTTSGSTEIPAWLENAAIENINKARDVSQIGYTPYYGPDVAAFSPMQQQSMRSTGNAASAFGLAPQGFNAMAGMPQAETFAGGLQGYSSAPLYEQSLDNLFANAPAQYNAMTDMFIDPFTGSRSRNNYGNASPVMGMARSDGGNGNSPYGNDANMAHLNRMKEQGASDVYDSIYQQTYTAGDLVNGDTFVGDDGLNYTVGYDVGQVDPSLANAVQRNKINEVRSNSSAIGSMIGNTLQGGPMSRLFEGITGVAPFNSNDAPVGSLSTDDVRDGRFGGLIGYEQENARAQSDAALRQANELNQNRLQNDMLRDDIYSNVSGGLLNGTALDRARLELTPAADGSYSLEQQASIDQAKARVAQINADRIAREQAAAQEAAIEAARAAAAEQARIQRQNDRGPESSGNSSGGYAKSKAPNEAGSRFGL